VLQPAGHLRLQHETLAADRIVGVGFEDLLERDLAVELRIKGHEDGSQSAAGVWPKDAEPLAIGRGGADRVRGGAIGLVGLARR
jgi:hypothetical protein